MVNLMDKMDNIVKLAQVEWWRLKFMDYIDDDILKILLSYANNDENIRAVLMEGSRAFGKVDKYSDYDIVYLTKSNEPYFNGGILSFLTDKFGEIAVMQTPDNGDPHDVYTHLIQFASGVRIDLTFNSLDFLRRVPLESATVVLMDKDEVFAGAAPPSDADFWLNCPSAEEFRNHCNEFWWCSPYVAKAVVRGQTLHALEVLGECVCKEYALMLSYLVGVRNNWEHVNPGKHYTNAKHLLPLNETHYYEALMNSYVHANDEDINLALDMLMRKYDTLAEIIAGELDYTYDSSEAEKTMKFINERMI